jgi:hypothetical protein
MHEWALNAISIKYPERFCFIPFLLTSDLLALLYIGLPLVQPMLICVSPEME